MLVYVFVDKSTSIFTPSLKNINNTEIKPALNINKDGVIKNPSEQDIKDLINEVKSQNEFLNQEELEEE